MDNFILSGGAFNEAVLKSMLVNLKDHAIETNKNDEGA